MVRFVLGIVCALALVTGIGSGEQPPDAKVISGPIDVVDGDTIDIGRTRIRLFGIDAVEQDQSCRTKQGFDWACGASVSRQARDQLQGRFAECEPTGDQTYGRVVAVCRIDGVDLQQTLVRQGLAFAYRRFSHDYVADEGAAAAKFLGLWASDVQRPAEFRAERSAFGDADPSCPIKGNISASGNIYHLPGSTHYAKTRISGARGERWFCSVAEAEQAGWRAAQG